MGSLLENCHGYEATKNVAYGFRSCDMIGTKSELTNLVYILILSLWNLILIENSLVMYFVYILCKFKNRQFLRSVPKIMGKSQLPYDVDRRLPDSWSPVIRHQQSSQTQHQHCTSPLIYAYLLRN